MSNDIVLQKEVSTYKMKENNTLDKVKLNKEVKIKKIDCMRKY